MIEKIKKQIRQFAEQKKSWISPIFKNNNAANFVADMKKESVDMLSELAIIQLEAVGQEIEDGQHIVKSRTKQLAEERIKAIAKKHASNAQFDGEYFDTYDPECAIVSAWGSFYGVQEAEHLYQETFFELTPNLNECGKCDSVFVEDSCPDCEKRRFQYDHRKGND